MKTRTQCFYRWIFGFENKLVSKADLRQTAKEFLKLSEIDRTEPDFEKHYSEVEQSQFESLREAGDLPELEIRLAHNRSKMNVINRLHGLKLKNAMLKYAGR